jgi:hypothetical protein
MAPGYLDFGKLDFGKNDSRLDWQRRILSLIFLSAFE